MDKAGHKLIAPVFSIGTSLLCLNTGLIDFGMDKILVSVTVGCASLISCTWPDADLLAVLPMKILMGTAKKRYSEKYQQEYYYVCVSKDTYLKKYKSRQKGNKSDLSKSKNKKDLIKNTEMDNKVEITKKGKIYIYYSDVSKANPIMKTWALLFKSIGLKKHRGWQSHSPLLWVPIFMLPTLGLLKLGGAYVYLSIFLFGLSMGYFSHLVGDTFTVEGGRLFPPAIENKIRSIPVLGTIYCLVINPMGGIKIGNKKIKFNFAKASNKNWAMIVTILMAMMFALIICPDVYGVVFSILGEIFKLFLKGSAYVGKFLMGVMRGRL